MTGMVRLLLATKECQQWPTCQWQEATRLDINLIKSCRQVVGEGATVA